MVISAWDERTNLSFLIQINGKEPKKMHEKNMSKSKGF